MTQAQQEALAQKYPDLKKVYNATKHAAGITHTVKQMGYEKE